MKHAPKRSILLSAAFALPCALTAAVFALCGLAPFGARTLGVMDMAHQYLPFLYSLRDVLAGRTDLLYLPSMCLGGNMLGVAAYYLASPLNLICCLFSREDMYTAVSLIYFLRVGLCGLTMCVYTGRRRGYGWRCLIPSTAYALMAYMVAYCFNYLWQDCVILLPLIALGIARLVRDRRPWLYIAALAAAMLMNFYIGYILCLFSVLFFLYEFLSVPKPERARPWRTLLACALSSLAAGALSAVLLLPTAYSLSGGKAAFSLSVLTFAPQFDLRALLSKLYIGAFDYEQIMPAGLPQIFSGTVTAALAMLYFLNPRIPRRRRALTGGLALVLALSFQITALDLIWHALNAPNWYNHRYSFLLSFLIAAAADHELAEFKAGTRERHLLVPVGIAAVVSALVFIGRDYTYVTWRSALAAALITGAACLILRGLKRPSLPGGMACALAAALLLVHAGDLAVNAGLSLRALTVPASDSRSYAEYVAAKAEAFDRLPTGDAFVRVESTTAFNQDRCEPMLFGYDGISHYGSTLSQDSLDFLQRVGVDRYTDIWAAYGPGVTEAADSLLGIRYVVSPALDKEYLPYAETGSYTVWENPNALPIGWTADSGVQNEISAQDCFSYLNALYAAAAPEVGGEIFVPAAFGAPETEGFATAGGARYELADGAMTGSMTYTVRPGADGPLYMQLGLADYPGVVVSVNGGGSVYYATAQTNGSLYLGDFTEGETVTVRLDAYSDVTLGFSAFATEDTNALGRYAAALRAGGCGLTKLSSSHYTGSFTAGEGDELLVLTLPYDGAWRVYLDGGRVEPIRVQDCLMAVGVGAGEHTLEMRYIPAGLIPGAAVSCLALAACTVVFALQKRKEKQP